MIDKMSDKPVDFGKPAYNLTIDSTITGVSTETLTSMDDEKYLTTLEFFHQFLGTEMHVTTTNYLFSDHSGILDPEKHRKAHLELTPINIESLLTLKGRIMQKFNSQPGDFSLRIVFEDNKIGYIRAKNSHFYLTESY